jgi:hypothetical protein
LFQRNFSRTHNSWRLLFSFQRPSLLPVSLRQNQQSIRFVSSRQLLFSTSRFFLKNFSATAAAVSVLRKLTTIHPSYPSVNLFFSAPILFSKDPPATAAAAPPSCRRDTLYITAYSTRQYPFGLIFAEVNETAAADRPLLWWCPGAGPTAAKRPVPAPDRR